MGSHKNIKWNEKFLFLKSVYDILISNDRAAAHNTQYSEVRYAKSKVILNVYVFQML